MVLHAAIPLFQPRGLLEDAREMVVGCISAGLGDVTHGQARVGEQSIDSTWSENLAEGGLNSA